MLHTTQVFLDTLCSIVAIILVPLLLIPLSYFSKPTTRLILLFLMGGAFGGLMQESIRLGIRIFFHPSHWYYLALITLFSGIVWLFFAIVHTLYPDSDLELLIGLSFHNLIRGYVIASSFIRSLHAGILSSIGITLSALWGQAHLMHYLLQGNTQGPFPLRHYLTVSIIMIFSAWATIYAHRAELVSAPAIRTAAFIFFTYLCFRILQDLRKLEINTQERILIFCAAIAGFLIS